jgi:hypothetical protein
MVGARVRWSAVAFPLGGLTATREQIIVSTGFTDAVLKRPNVQSVYRGRFLFRKRIAFGADDHSADRVFVYSLTPRRILRALAELGWPVAE